MREYYKKDEKEILVVSFGTSYNNSRDVTIGAIENAIRKSYPDYNICRAFTSQIIIDKLKKRDGIIIDNVKEAMDKAVSKGIKELIIQPTHLLNGLEYMELADDVKSYTERFERIVLAKPLLTDSEDFNKVIDIIAKIVAEYDINKTAVCFMGHGTEAEANNVYIKLQNKIFASGYKNCYIGTVEAKPDILDIVKEVKKGDYNKIILLPLMIVAGDHANNDMAGDDEESWKKHFEKEGYEVECILKGLGENIDIQKIFIEHTHDAIMSVID